MVQLVDRGMVEEMVARACRIVTGRGLGTRNNELLHRAGENESLAVRNGRIYPAKELLDSCLAHIKGNSVPRNEIPVNNHGWLDMIINSGDDADVVIKLTDLPFQYCDHEKRAIEPLTRDRVIEGTKLLHRLSELYGVRGYSCGVPQDTHAQLKAIEQYLIGYRYHRRGGGTIQSVPREAEAGFSLIRSVAEDWEDPRERDLMFFSPSPLILDADDLYLCFKEKIILRSFMVGSMPMMGMTGPIDPVGVYILGIAEVLGAAAILHAIFPEARAYVYPHPQTMSLQTGQMAFGTIEHARLEMMKLKVMEVLGLPYYNLKDIMTSAQMPGPTAQGDKALGFYTGITAGFRAFNLMPLSTDQVWSPVQALLDIENLRNAWKALEPLGTPVNFEEITTHIGAVMDEGILFSESDHTLLHMHEHYDTDSFLKRHFSSETWASSGRPEELVAVSEKVDELVGGWDYRPPQEKLERILDLYHGMCKKLNQAPIDLD